MPRAKRNVSPLDALSEGESLFCQYIAIGGLDGSAAHIAAFEDDERKGQGPVLASERLLEKDKIKRAIDYLKGASDEDIARDHIRQVALSPKSTAAAKKAAADTLLRLEEKGQASEGFELWMKHMLEIGAEVRKPVPKRGSEVSVSLADLVDGRAYLYLPPKARVELLHRAGAPWNDQDPDARLSALQVELLSRDERFVFCNGGSGVGKSTVGGGVVLLNACIPNQKVAILAATYDKCFSEFQYAWTGFMNLFGMSGACTTRQVFTAEKRNYNMELRTIWGASVECFSMEHDGGSAVLGREFDIIVYGEGSLISPEIHQRKVIRATARRVKRRTDSRDPNYYRPTGRVYGCSTPDGFGGAISDEWDRVLKVTGNAPEKLQLEHCTNWLESAYLREATALENPSYSPEAYEAARKSLPPDIFAEQFMGRRVRRSGLIYKEWDEATMLVTMPAPADIAAMRLSCGFDTGKHFSAGIMGLDQNGVLWRLGETCGVEQKISDNADQVREMLIRVLGPVFQTEQYEEIRPHIDIWPCDPSSPHKMDLMDLLGAPIWDATMTVQGSIDRIRKLMADDSFRVVRETTHDPVDGMGFRYEVAKYVWKVTKTAKGWNDGRTRLEPVKLDDHTMDELRYDSIPLLDLGLPSHSPPQPHREPTLGQHLRAGLAGRGASRHVGPAYRGVHYAA
jgi:hypothetical protein